MKYVILSADTNTL